MGAFKSWIAVAPACPWPCCHHPTRTLSPSCLHFDLLLPKHLCCQTSFSRNSLLKITKRANVATGGFILTIKTGPLRSLQNTVSFEGYRVSLSVMVKCFLCLIPVIIHSFGWLSCLASYNFIYLFNIYLFIFGCIGSSLQHAGFYIVVCRLRCPTACEILVPRPGIKPASPALQGRFLTTGSPGKFVTSYNFRNYLLPLSPPRIVKVWGW